MYIYKGRNFISHFFVDPGRKVLPRLGNTVCGGGGRWEPKCQESIEDYLENPTIYVIFLLLYNFPLSEFLTNSLVLKFTESRKKKN
jgi:hypothetical protein